MLKEFREFIARGNVLDLAVGVIVGAAFGAIVNSLVNDVIMPPIGLILGKLDFANLHLVLKEGATPGPYPTVEAAKNAGAVVLGYGSFLNSVVSFLIVSFVIFLIVKQVNRMRRQEAEEPAAPAAPTTTEHLLTEIRDLLAKR